MSDKSLIQMTQDVLEVERALMENDGLLPPEIEERFNLTTGDLRSKVDAYKIIMLACESRAEYFRDIEKQAQAARRTFENCQEGLKNNLKYSMHSMDTRELIGNDWRYLLSPGKDRLVIDADTVPDKYKITEQIKVVDKALVEADLKMGFEIPGATLEKSETLRSYLNTGNKKQIKEN